METCRIKQPTAMAYRKRVCKAMNFINRNQERDLPLEEIADALACISIPPGTVPEAPLDIQTISGGPYSVCHCEIPSTGFQQAWEDTFTRLVDSGHECDDRPCYERYYNNPSDDPEGKWIVDICIPLKPRKAMPQKQSPARLDERTRIINLSFLA